MPLLHLQQVLAVLKKIKTYASLCEKTVRSNQDLYNTAITNNYTVISAVITETCLSIQFGSSGCDPKNWMAELVYGKAAEETNLGKRFLRMSLANKEVCTAVFSKTVSLDIYPLRQAGRNSIKLQLEGFSQELIYAY